MLWWHLVNKSILTSLALLVPAIGAAQPGAYGPPPPPPPPPGYYAQPVAAPVETARRGFLFGFSLGGGSMSCDDCNDSLSGVALDIHLGGMVTPQLALMFDGMGVAHAFEEGGSLVNVVNTFAAQYWVTPQFWIKGGLGFGRISLNDEDGEEIEASETGTAAMGAVGFELLSSRTFALDLQLRGAVTHYDDIDIQMGSLNVGVNWY